MAITQRKRTVVNPARKNAARKFSPAQIKAGFGGSRRKAAAKTKRRHKPAARTNPKRMIPKHLRDARKALAKRRAAARTNPKRRSTRQNLGKIISFSLPKESNSVAKTKRNGRKTKSNRVHRGPAAKSTWRKTLRATHRRRTKHNPSMGDLTGLVSSAVFTIAGAVGSKYLTQFALQANNTGVMGYVGNLVAAFALSYGVKAFMKNDKAAASVLAGGIVQVVLRLITDYTPFGQYTANLGMGDYMAQDFRVPQRMADGMHSALITTAPTLGMQTMAGMSGCGGSLYGSSNLYAA